MYKTSHLRIVAFQLNPLPQSLYPCTLVVLFSMRLSVVVLVLEEEVFVSAVSGETDCRDTETGETALETVPAAIGTLVSPGLAAEEGQYIGSILFRRVSKGLRTFAPRDRIEAGRLMLGTPAC
jgi:hypothetical protein